MPLLSISAAARVVNRSRGTIQNYLKAGKISSVIDESGNPKIDTSELIRVFGELLTDGTIQARNDISKIAGDRQENSTIVEILREQLKVSQERERALLAMLEQEQRARHELQLSLEGNKRSWLDRLLGR